MLPLFNRLSFVAELLVLDELVVLKERTDLFEDSSDDSVGVGRRGVGVACCVKEAIATPVPVIVRSLASERTSMIHRDPRQVESTWAWTSCSR